MGFIDFVFVIRRHKLVVCAGLTVAVAVAVFSSYRLDGSKLVSRSRPMYETTALVAVKPGAEINPPQPSPAATTSPPTTATTTIATTTTVFPAPTAAQVNDGAPTTGVATLSPTTATTATTPTAYVPLADDVIDVRSLYSAALSIQTAVVSPGFAEAVRESTPTMDGSIAAVVTLDTNTIRLVVDGSTPERAAEVMDAALAQLRPMVRSYATSTAFRFRLDIEVLSGPSTPSVISSIKAPLTSTAVFFVAVVMLWIGIRALDLLQLNRRESDQLKRAQESRAEADERRQRVEDEPWPQPS